MNDYSAAIRHRNRTLLIVEGKHEKDELFWLVFKCFPELNIEMDNVWIYGTNIYKLYDDIVKEYGINWAEEEIDVDLPFVISRKEHQDVLCHKDDFTDIILVFDYERHDPEFSAVKIANMQRCFDDSTDMGKLYLNYPMIESYMHLRSLNDENYINLKVPVSLQPGERYKALVRAESAIKKSVDLPHRIRDLLADKRYMINDEKIIQECCYEILEISSNDTEKILEEILSVIADAGNARTLKYQLKDWINRIGYTNENVSYWKYMRKVFQNIIYHNINKAYKIQYSQKNGKTLRTKFECIDLNEVLSAQNDISGDMEKGYILVLSTCLFLIPDYNFDLIN